MAAVGNDVSVVLEVLAYMKTALEGIDGTRQSLQSKYQALGQGWQDTNYQRLGEIVQEVDTAAGRAESALMEAADELVELYEALRAYEEVALGGTADFLQDKPKTLRMSSSELAGARQANKQAIDEIIANTKESLLARGVQKGAWLEKTLEGYRQGLEKESDALLRVAAGEGGDVPATEIPSPDSLAVRYFNLPLAVLDSAPNCRATPGYRATLKTRFAKAVPSAQRLFSDFADQLAVRDAAHACTAHYRPGGPDVARGIYFNILNDREIQIGMGTTYYHETGHMLDHAGGSFSGYLSDTPGFREAVVKDGLHFQEQYRQASEELRGTIDQRLYSGVMSSCSDLLDAVTEGGVTGGYTHDPIYWQTHPVRLQREAFAHFFEAAMGGGERQQWLRAVFPNAYQMFNNILNNR